MTQKKKETDFAEGKRVFARLSQPIFNREAKLPKDGYYQIVPRGEVVGYLDNGKSDGSKEMKQVIDDAAIHAMVANSGEVLLDYEHFSWDRSKSTEAAGWIKNWQVREDGVYGQIEWSDSGKAAIEGKRYRYLSPTFLHRDMEDLGNGRYRPTRIADAGLTNKPNFKNLKPLSNKDSGNGGSDDQKPKTETKIMNEEVAALLGLKPDAAEGSVTEAVKNASALLEKGRKFDQLEQDFKALKNKVESAEVDAILNKHAKVVNDENRDMVKALLNSDRENGEKFLDSLSAKADQGSAHDASKRVHNRETAKTPDGSPDSNVAEQQNALVQKIMNRDGHKDFEVAWNAARMEQPALFR